jgi:hypothetical protein
LYTLYTLLYLDLTGDCSEAFLSAVWRVHQTEVLVLTLYP